MSSIIYIVVEGSTEENFVNQILKPHFMSKNVILKAQQYFTNKKLKATGGGKSFAKIENHIRTLLTQNAKRNDVFVSTMIDLYAFPKQGNSIYDNEVANCLNGKSKVEKLEAKFGLKIANKKFIPYVQLHEFEALLLVDPGCLLSYFTNSKREVSSLKANIGNMKPEEVNETPSKAPSKRIEKFLKGYSRQKSSAAIVSLKQIDLWMIREKCPHFDSWLVKLEYAAGS